MTLKKSRPCDYCGERYECKRLRAPGYCSVRCRVAAHRSWKKAEKSGEGVQAVKAPVVKERFAQVIEDFIDDEDHAWRKPTRKESKGNLLRVCARCGSRDIAGLNPSSVCQPK